MLTVLAVVIVRTKSKPTQQVDHNQNTPLLLHLLQGPPLQTLYSSHSFHLLKNNIANTVSTLLLLIN